MTPFANMSLEEAANLVATRIKTASVVKKVNGPALPTPPRMRTPAAGPPVPSMGAPATASPLPTPPLPTPPSEPWGNMPTGALIGGGIGAGAGLLRSLMNRDEDERQNWLRNTLLGGALGAGVGGGIGYGMDAFSGADDPHTPTAQNFIDRLTAAKQEETAKAQQMDPLTRLFRSLTQRKSGFTPEQLAEFEKHKLEPEHHSDLAPAGVGTPAEAAMAAIPHYYGNPTALGVGTGAGYAAGYGIDRWRHANSAVAPNSLRTMKADSLPPALSRQVLNFQAAAAMPQSKITASRGGGVTASFAIPEQHLNNPKFKNTYNIPQQNWNDIKGIVREGRPVGWTGRRLGTAAGAILTPWTEKVRSMMFD